MWPRYIGFCNFSNMVSSSEIQVSHQRSQQMTSQALQHWANRYKRPFASVEISVTLWLHWSAATHAGGPIWFSTSRTCASSMLRAGIEVAEGSRTRSPVLTVICMSQTREGYGCPVTGETMGSWGTQNPEGQQVIHWENMGKSRKIQRSWRGPTFGVSLLHRRCQINWNKSMGNFRLGSPSSSNPPSCSCNVRSSRRNVLRTCCLEFLGKTCEKDGQIHGIHQFCIHKLLDFGGESHAVRLMFLHSHYKLHLSKLQPQLFFCKLGTQGLEDDMEGRTQGGLMSNGFGPFGMRRHAPRFNNSERQL